MRPHSRSRLVSCASAFAFALAAASLAAASARADAAQPAPPSHGPHLQAAIRLYQKLDLEAALAELRLAEEEAKGNDPELVTTLVYEGLIFAENGKYAQTMEHFKRALAISPWVDVPEGTAPRIARQFSDARRELWGSSGIKAPPRKRRRAFPPTTAPAAAEPVAPLPAEPPGRASGQPAAPPQASPPQASPPPASPPPASQPPPK